MNYFIKADKFFYPYETKDEGYLEIIGGHFGNYYVKAPVDATIIDYSGKWIAPGLVDTHIHGFDGADVMDNDYKKIFEKMSNGLLRAGVTSWLPTPLTGNHDLLKEVCELIGEHYSEAKGAKIQGLFFEGPYFTAEHKGAQNPAYMTDPNVAEFDKWNRAAKGLIRKFAIAPERAHAVDFVNALSGQGVAVALGHSNATYDQALAAIEAGASIFVHTYNGMSGFNHREPGMVGAALSTPNTYTELICDGHHVHPVAAKVMLQAKGAEHVVLITDSMRAAGLSDGEYMLGEFPVIVKNGAAHLKEGDSLAGSILMLKDAIKNVVDWEVATPEEAIMMATLTAAKSVGIDDRCGQIKKGLAADFIVLTPEMDLKNVYLDGVQRI
ncbi:N-acetylglucosamine-6-phosphate deacetylase [Lactococcus fujiensis]|uniref:N-acetylglucosamine-6-phosphate deacetylase n=1 Tax=Lactococcus fujiensis JCM 16395 TaxID=1291764 RepID=A0A2A5RKF7_9LACT|nr:N-acetylglucosamine-6-phosphate deacetylase [Lactococcus fujiensis]PCR99656.1 N-acetylglucosamine-6-phosphate deacetylase [Lactococcus fujiensis JCM 16395]